MKRSASDPEGPPRRSRSLPRSERLRDGKTIRRVFGGCEQSFSESGVRLLVRRNGLGTNRVLISATRGFSGAVRRNRVRRLIREAYRVRKPRIQTGYDLVFLAYPGQYSGSQRQERICVLLDRAGLLDARST